LGAYFGAYSDCGVRVALTLSRLSVDKEDYGDAYCDRILGAAEEHGAQVILCDDGLADHIRAKRPGLRLVCSLNRAMCDFKDRFGGLGEAEYYRRLLDRYDEVVIRCEFAQSDANLESLADVSGRCEIIVNQFCIPDCLNVYRHVSCMEDWSGGTEAHPCFSLSRAANLRRRLSDNLHFSNARINEFAVQGFTRMKLAGRNATMPGFLDMVADYVFEPTGAISFLRGEISRQYMKESSRVPGGIAPFALPGPMEFS
jgi:hypothetical protein